MSNLNTLTILELNTAIRNSSKIVIITHKNPDGDAIGSSLGLYHYLKENNIETNVIVNDAVPSFLSFLPQTENIVVFDENKDECIKHIQNAEIIICTDFAQVYRCGDLQPFIESSKAIKVNIDHHPNPDTTFNFYYHQIEASSTSELIYLFIKEMDSSYSFSKNVASCLYTGLLTDTGCFKHALRPQTFIVAAQLLQSGISYELIVSNIFDTNTPEKLNLIGFALNEKLQVLSQYRTAFISISFDEATKLGLIKGDTEGLVNYALSINNTVMGAFFYEREKGKTKISLRSKGKFAVNEISNKYFSGGGHKNAAGGEYIGTVEETINKFLEILPQYKNELTSLEIGIRD